MTLEVPAKMTGVIWHCPSSHRNAFHGSGTCMQCGHAPLVASYEVYLQQKGKYGRYNLSEAVAVRVLGAAHAVYQGIGTGPMERLRSSLQGAASKWNQLLIQRDHPALIGAFSPMEMRTIVGVQ
jgi:hypothetical protein